MNTTISTTAANNGSTAMKSSRHRLLLLSSAVALVMLAGRPALAQTAPDTGICTSEDCDTQIRGKSLDNSSSGTLAVGENTERETPAD